jgi:hypothetical protein
MILTDRASNEAFMEALAVSKGRRHSAEAWRPLRKFVCLVRISPSISVDGNQEQYDAKKPASAVKLFGESLSTVNALLGTALRAELPATQRKRAALRHEHAARSASDHLRRPVASRPPSSRR